LAKQKYYVVWNGPSPGVYSSWEACQEAVNGVSGAKYKSFKSQAEAEDAFEMGEEAYESEASSSGSTGKSDNSGKSGKPGNLGSSALIAQPDRPAYNPANLPVEAIREAIAVDAACSGNPGAMEYRGVYLANGREIFHFGPIHGTNNIGEFLAIVHGLALLKQKGLDTMPIYSDSVNAQLWVRKHQCKTTLVRNDKTEKLHQMIERAEGWLKNNTYRNPIIKWQTDKWGEIPADFGRK
jgi:ribonuclease HI